MRIFGRGGVITTGHEIFDDFATHSVILAELRAREAS